MNNMGKTLRKLLELKNKRVWCWASLLQEDKRQPARHVWNPLSLLLIFDLSEMLAVALSLSEQLLRPRGHRSSFDLFKLSHWERRIPRLPFGLHFENKPQIGDANECNYGTGKLTAKHVLELFASHLFSDLQIGVLMNVIAGKVTTTFLS